MKLFAALARFLHRQPPTHPAPAQFDDGLTEIARLIAANDHSAVYHDGLTTSDASDLPKERTPGRPPSRGGLQGRGR
jgi:hypothetical protein